MPGEEEEEEERKDTATIRAAVKFPFVHRTRDASKNGKDLNQTHSAKSLVRHSLSLCIKHLRLYV